MTVAEPAPAISLITTCKGRLAFLQQSLPRMVAQPHAEVVLVDFDCPEGSGSWAEKACPAVRVVRVADAPFFHAARARNLGAQAARAPWFCFVDADVLIADRFVEQVLPALREGAYYTTSGAEVELVGTTVCRRGDHFEIEGYDEVIEGWGCEDTDYYARLQLLDRRRETLPAGLLEVVSHDNDTRMRFHATKDRWATQRANALYSQVKYDVARQFGNVNLPLDMRRQLYAEARHAMNRALATGRPESMEVNLSGNPAARLYHGWQMRRVWRYLIEPPPAVQPQAAMAVPPVNG